MIAKILYGGRVLQQAGSSYRRFVPLYMWDFIQLLLTKKRKETIPVLQCHVPLYRWCSFLNTFCEFVIHIYSIELEIKDTTDPTRSATYLELHVEIDNEGWLRTKLYNKKRWFQVSQNKTWPSKDKEFNLRCLFVYMKHIWLIVDL